MPRTYDRKYTDLRGGYRPKTRHSKPWTCGGKKVTYNDIRGNAFYCGGPNDDYIAYDNSFLFPRLNQRFGSVSAALVLAHETGHAVQHRAGVNAPSIVIELQADCFAGAWTRYARDSQDDSVQLVPTALDSSVAVMLTLRDQVGTPAANPQAHGLGFDRVNAFQTGYEKGPRACARFPVAGVPTTELPFRTPLESRTGGNLPFAAAVPLLAKSLDRFWTAALQHLHNGTTFSTPRRVAVQSQHLPACAGHRQPSASLVLEYCPPGNTVYWVDELLRRVHSRLGDMATGGLFSDAWGQSAQSQAALPTTGREAGLQRDCFTGAWLSTIAAGAQPTVALSPGDIDEVLTVIVASSFQPGAEKADRGGAFEQTKALRTGILNGITACS
jgi:predicted metalloprotease